MKIYFVTSECSPFIKSGGLADVSHALPKQLATFGHDVRVALPLYKGIDKKHRDQLEYVKNFSSFMPIGDRYAGIFRCQQEGVTYYFIDNEEYFGRDDLYGYNDDGARFAFFSRASMELLEHMLFSPDIIHLNDWHTGPAAAIFKDAFSWKESYQHTKIIFTIHNLKYQGIYPYSVLKDCVGLSDSYFKQDGFEHFGNMNYLKGGVNYADYITTVSKTYAEELQYDYFSEGLHSLLQHKAGIIRGIVNGIDYELFNPKTDIHVPFPFDAKTLENKKKNKLALQERLGLDVNESVPLISMISRLVSNKGFDLLSFVFDEMMEENVQFVLIGSGERDIEDRFIGLSHIYRGRVSTHTCFNVELAQEVYAASDIFLMPSRFEPCGLGQLIAMRYGTIPVVRQTGGLKDTVTPYNKVTGEGNGFGFMNYNAHELLFTIKDALSHYRDEKTWKKIVRQAMKRDSSWKKSAKEYEDLYKEVLER